MQHTFSANQQYFSLFGFPDTQTVKMLAKFPDDYKFLMLTYQVNYWKVRSKIESIKQTFFLNVYQGYTLFIL